MLKAIAEISLKTKIAKDNSLRKKQFLPWSKIEKIALILNEKDRINKSKIDNFISKTEKFVEVFYVELNSKQVTYDDWQCFSRKDKSLLNLPKEILLRQLAARKFDVVINTANDDNLYAISIASSIHAPLRCGSSSKFDDVDLIVKKTSPDDVINYLNNVINYIKMIRVQ